MTNKGHTPNFFNACLMLQNAWCINFSKEISKSTVLFWCMFRAGLSLFTQWLSNFCNVKFQGNISGMVMAKHSTRKLNFVKSSVKTGLVVVLSEKEPLKLSLQKLHSYDRSQKLSSLFIELSKVRLVQLSINFTLSCFVTKKNHNFQGNKSLSSRKNAQWL